MAKESFLIVSLKESKAKKLAQVLTNETSLKILNYLSTKDSTESEIAKDLNVPISTVHYNIQQLVDARMVKSTEFHYSDKGKEVKHYTLANKYILIAPEKEGLRERLKGILPLSAILLASAAAIQFVPDLINKLTGNNVAMGGGPAMRSIAPVASDAMYYGADALETGLEDGDAAVGAMKAVAESAPNLMQTVADNASMLIENATMAVDEVARDSAGIVMDPSVQESMWQGFYVSPAAVWFLIGAAATILVYFVLKWIRKE